MTIEGPDLAHLAGVLDAFGVIRVRTYAGDGKLPYVALHGPNTALLRYVGGLTGAKVVVTRRGYYRAGCSEHCPEQHQHITSESGRWSVSGSKATVVLAAVRPYLRVRGYDADEALEVGLRAGRKPATLTRMVALGWPVPDAWTPEMSDTRDARP